MGEYHIFVDMPILAFANSARTRRLDLIAYTDTGDTVKYYGVEMPILPIPVPYWPIPTPKETRK